MDFFAGESTEFFDAIKNVDYETVKALIKNDRVSCNAVSYNTRTSALMVACIKSNKMALLLLDKGVDKWCVRIQNNKGYTALMYAFKNHHFQAAKRMLECGARDGATNITNNEGYTALMYACKAYDSTLQYNTNIILDMIEKKDLLQNIKLVEILKKYSPKFYAFLLSRANNDTRYDSLAPDYQLPSDGSVKKHNWLKRTTNESYQNILTKIKKCDLSDDSHLFGNYRSRKNEDVSTIIFNELVTISETLKNFVHNVIYNLDDGNNLLMYACRYSPELAIELIVDTSCCDINCVNEDGYTPLMYACKYNPELVSLLLDYGADHSIENNGRTALSLAYIKGNFDAVIQLLNSGSSLDFVNINKCKKQLLLSAFEQGAFGIGSRFISSESSNIKNSNGSTPLMLVSSIGDNCDIVSQLLCSGAIRTINDADDYEFTALMNACMVENSNVAFKLLAAGADGNIGTGDGITPIVLACENNNFVIALDLLELFGFEIAGGFDILQNYLSELLVCACKEEKFFIAADLLNYVNGDNFIGTLDANFRDWRGYAPLLYACKFNNVRCALKLLEQNGIDANIFNDGGKTPLIYACIKSKQGLVSRLIRKGANVNLYDFNYKTPLMYACKYQAHLINCLITSGANINDSDEIGKTALMYLCQYGDSDDNYGDLKDLLNHNELEIDKKDDLGFTALMYACKYNHGFIEDLVKAGADIRLIARNLETASIIARDNLAEARILRFFAYE